MISCLPPVSHMTPLPGPHNRALAPPATALHGAPNIGRPVR
ncbi:hypothetical protein BSU04_20685 [Caballeronia sordidicola]|uniref:Uncharacterized protein n=1 Tax=Caballeronia sordidicola TaxID=196367 RepID=A0A226WZP6_CABSO|nr:hypothetical protein BSU04_20685 [Caballeronia sordidicola]